MAQYICLLRGINVGGKRIIKMEALRQTFLGLGAREVQSYIQSGNIIFVHEEQNVFFLNEQISEAILKTYELVVPVITITSTKFKAIMQENPFDDSPELWHVNFLATQPNPMALADLQASSFLPDEIHCTDNAVYLRCLTGYHKTKLSQIFLERKLKVNVTTRNWKTVEAIASLLATK